MLSKDFYYFPLLPISFFPSPSPSSLFLFTTTPLLHHPPPLPFSLPHLCFGKSQTAQELAAQVHVNSGFFLWTPCCWDLSCAPLALFCLFQLFGWEPLSPLKAAMWPSVLQGTIESFSHDLPFSLSRDCLLCLSGKNSLVLGIMWLVRLTYLVTLSEKSLLFD